mgnify:CR=1 FL=1
MKTICLFISIILATSGISDEEKLFNKLRTLYKKNAFMWEIANQYYELAKFYAKSHSTDKAFIMLKRAKDFGYINIESIYNGRDFETVRMLKHWKLFRNLGDEPREFTPYAFYSFQMEMQKQRFSLEKLELLTDGNSYQKYKAMFLKFKKYILIKAFTYGNESIYEIFYKFDETQKKFIEYKRTHFSIENELLFEYFSIQKKSIFYFYYKNKVWAVEYKDTNGIINWRML